MKIIINNGLIYDGSGKKAVKKNLIIEDDKIKALTEKTGIEADEIIDATDCVVTPGFIDTHRHCDLAALTSKDFGRIEVSQGLTSVFGGNCGLSCVPTSPEHRQEIYDFIEPCLGSVGTGTQHGSFLTYMEDLEKREQLLNMGSFVGTGTIKAAVKGYGKESFSSVDMARAKRLLRESLEAGAVGVSMGIMYQPECYSSREEMIDLLSAVTPFQRVLTCHMRGEGDNLVSSVKEIISIAKEAELPLNISHLKAAGIRNWGRKIHQAMEYINDARSMGQDITVDFYPYCGGSTTLLSLLPPSMMESGIEDTLKKLSTKDGKEMLAKEINKEHQGWDNMVTAIGWERILLSSVTLVKNKKYSGKNFMEASIAAGYEEPSYFLCDLLVEEHGKVGIIVLSMSQDDVDAVARLPFAMVISDALYGIGDNLHPRLYGSFPKIIREYVLNRNVLTMEDAVKKMTSLPAKRLKIHNRGLITPGNIADIAVFDKRQIRDHAEFENPKQLCTGLKAVLVNGTPVIKNDIILRQNCGKILRFNS